MPTIFGQKLTRAEYLRRVGSEEQAFGIRAVEYASGKAQSIRAFQADLGSGLSFSVNENKAMDLFSFRYKGVSYGFVTKAELSSPAIADEQGMAYRYNLGAGFMYTAGLANVGGCCEEDGFYHYAHGSMKNLPATHVAWETLWDGDECELRLAGDVRDAAFFGRNLLLHREIRGRIGEKRLVLEDTIQNQGFAPEQLMLLYHMNLGYPLLDRDARLIAPVLSQEPLSPHTQKNDPDYARMILPIDNNEEYLHALRLAADADGRTLCAVYNDRLQLGLWVRYNTEPLRWLIVWKCMKSGDYALGVLPASCKPLGRAADRAAGEAVYLDPFAEKHIRLEIGVIDGTEELQAVQREIDALKRG